MQKTRKESHKATAIFRLIMVFSLVFIMTFSCALPAAAATRTIKLNTMSKTLYVGQTYNLKISGAEGKRKWSSSNAKVAKVSSTGKITALKSGKTTISVTAAGKN